MTESFNLDVAHLDSESGSRHVPSPFMALFDRFPLRFVVPNAVTCTSIILGLASIRISLQATTFPEFSRAAWFILYTVLLDKLDGAVARRLNASSELGVQLDSFSDFVTFGIAPAALVSAAIPIALPETYGSGPGKALVLSLAALYVVAAALRLAKFNVTTTSIHPRFFLGLPSTSSGGLLASAFLSHQELGLPTSLLSLFVAALAINGVLMVSNLPQPKMHISRRKPIFAFQLLVIASVYVLVPLQRFPTYLVAIASTYTLVGFVYGVLFTRREGPLREA